jgi:hypothetical protein
MDADVAITNIFGMEVTSAGFVVKSLPGVSPTPPRYLEGAEQPTPAMLLAVRIALPGA